MPNHEKALKGLFVIVQNDREVRCRTVVTEPPPSVTD
jgi:hypothetical protein